jgi:hypothetical protein
MAVTNFTVLAGASFVVGFFSYRTVPFSSISRHALAGMAFCVKAAAGCAFTNKNAASIYMEKEIRFNGAPEMSTEIERQKSELPGSRLVIMQYRYHAGMSR